MKIFTIALVVTAIIATCLADESEKDKWWFYPKTNEVPLNTLDLTLHFKRKGKGIQSPNVLLLRYKNIGNTTIDAWHARAIFSFGTMHLDPPHGTNVQRRIPRSFIGPSRLGPLAETRDIKPGETMEFPIRMPLQNWFTSTTNLVNGKYTVWWQIEDTKSNTLILLKDGEEISRIEEKKPNKILEGIDANAPNPQN